MMVEGAIALGGLMVLVMLVVRKLGKKAGGGDGYTATSGHDAGFPHHHHHTFHNRPSDSDRDCAPVADSRSDTGFCGPSDSGGGGDSGGGSSD